MNPPPNQNQNQNQSPRQIISPKRPLSIYVPSSPLTSHHYSASSFTAMTMLRSREVPSLPAKPRPETLKRHPDIEPVTPTRTHEPNAHQSPPQPRSGVGPLSVPIRRRSLRLRLASKSNGCECPDGGRTESESVGSRHTRHESVRDGIGHGANENGVVTRRKRRSNVDDVTVSGFQEGEIKGLLSFRSGKKVVNRKVEDEAFHAKEMEMENRESGKSDPLNGKLDSDAELNSLNENVNEIPEYKKKRKTVLRDISQERDENGAFERNKVVRMVGDGLVMNEKLNAEADMSGNVDNGKKGKRELGDLIEESVARKKLEKSMNSDDNSVKRNAEKKGKKVMEGVREEGVVSKKFEKNESFDKPSSSRGRKRPTREEKGKEIMVENSPLLYSEKMDLGVEMEINNGFSDCVAPDVIELEETLEHEIELREKNERNDRRNESRTEQFRDIARKNASRFAYFDAEGEEDNDLSDEELQREVEDWPGPFATAMKIIRDREDKVNLQIDTFVSSKTESIPLMWVPKKDQSFISRESLTPSLQELCMKVLAKNADAITSLDYVPDALRHTLCRSLCDSRRINVHFLDLLVQGSPTEICLPDCSWLTEEQFTECFKRCDTSNLMVLQLDQCGRCMPDYILLSTLARSLSGLPMLSTLSLSGACRLSDVGLQALVSAAPTLRSVNLSQCSLLTSSSIDTLADSLGSVLKELYINDCQGIDPMLILPALKKLEKLEVLSLAGIQSVRDRFIREIVISLGHNLKELILTDCVKLTDFSVEVIAESCPGLRVLDLVNLCKLTDSALSYLANGCQEMEKLKLCRNSFSDEAMAAFLETAGEFLKELSLNNVRKVGHNTALSLAKRSRKLHTLDLSWCRNLTDNALGYIVDNCSSLSMLKLFGCSQITSRFFNGHSNPNVKIIGLKMSPVLDHLKVPDHTEAP